MQIDLARVPSILARWWLLLVAGVIVGGAAGYVATRGMPPIYQASVTVQVTRSPDAPTDDPDRVLKLIRTTTELVQTPQILSQAAARVGIVAAPSQLQERVSAAPVRETQLLRITVEDTEPDRVAEFAVVLVDVLAAHMDEAQAARFAASKASTGQAVQSLRDGIEIRELKVAELRAEPASSVRDAALALAESELQEARNSYASALKAQADLLLLEARSRERLTVFEPPQVPAAPIRPSRARAMMIGSFGGLTVALGVVFGAVYANGLWSRRRRLERSTGLPVLIDVPVCDSSGIRAGRVAAGYGSLPARIVEQGVAVRSILVTSAQALEQKSSVAASVAVALARSGRRVVLVDGNLRQPAQARLFDVADGAGLSTLLFTTGKPAESVLRETAIGGLRLLTAGPLPPDPAAFLREYSTRDRLTELYALSDVVIVDAPPISAGPDAFLFGLDTDATVLVVDAREPSTDAAAGAVAALNAAGIRTIGTILHGDGGGAQAESSAHEQSAVQQPIGQGQLQLTPSRGKPWW